VVLDAGNGTATFVLKRMGDMLSDTYSGVLGEGHGAVKGDQVEWSFQSDQAGKIVYTGMLDGTSKLCIRHRGQGAFTAEKKSAYRFIRSDSASAIARGLPAPISLHLIVHKALWAEVVARASSESANGNLRLPVKRSPSQLLVSAYSGSQSGGSTSTTWPGSEGLFSAGGSSYLVILKYVCDESPEGLRFAYYMESRVACVGSEPTKGRRAGAGHHLG
jgi:hypothetical protein